MKYFTKNVALQTNGTPDVMECVFYGAQGNLFYKELHVYGCSVERRPW